MLFFATYIKGQTPFSEFTAVLMLDDIEVGYYSSNEQKLLPRGLINEGDLSTDQENALFVLTRAWLSAIDTTQMLLHHYNATSGKYSQDIMMYV